LLAQDLEIVMQNKIGATAHAVTPIM
jgi:hypothetical protein